MRQFVTCKFRPGDTRKYTYHNDGDPVAPGDKVIVDAPRAEGKITIEVCEIVGQPRFETKPILGKAPPPELAQNERRVLDWLAKEESSALGECKGPDLDRIVALGLASISPAPAGQDADYSRVSLTAAGHELAKTPPAEPKPEQAKPE